MNDLKQEAKDRITFNTGDRERDACWESAVYTLIDEYIDKATAQEKKRCADKVANGLGAYVAGVSVDPIKIMKGILKAIESDS